MSKSKNVSPAGDLFLPTLLDRLSEQGGGAMNRSAFRRTVLRDLNWLLNCTNIEGQLPIQNLPYVRNSVLNFGIPPLAGARFAESELDAVAAGIQRSLACFEPRILPESLKVSVIRDKETDVYRYNHARFRIEASYWFEPYPIDMVVRAHWDMETGGVELREEQ
ncbi:MAG: GPW/gp25 family protein [Azoarcus sp.]|jgi:type VI secretion system protein ImpF|nr:GPW/gp25 family protein [Azoarcus sp.]